MRSKGGLIMSVAEFSLSEAAVSQAARRPARETPKNRQLASLADRLPEPEPR